MERYRIVIADEPEPDFSWLEQECFAGEDASQHVALLMVVERECSCCGSWVVAESLGNIDMYYWDAITGTFDDVAEISVPYLRATAVELLAEAVAA